MLTGNFPEQEGTALAYRINTFIAGAKTPSVITDGLLRALAAGYIGLPFLLLISGVSMEMISCASPGGTLSNDREGM